MERLPLVVTDHAVDRYLERVRACSRADAVDDITVAMYDAVFLRDSHGGVMVECRGPLGRRFRAVLYTSLRKGTTTVVTVLPRSIHRRMQPGGRCPERIRLNRKKGLKRMAA